MEETLSLEQIDDLIKEIDKVKEGLLILKEKTIKNKKLNIDKKEIF